VELIHSLFVYSQGKTGFAQKNAARIKLIQQEGKIDKDG